MEPGKKRFVVIVSVAVLIAGILAAGILISGKPKEVEYQLINTVTLLKGETTRVAGSDYSLRFKEMGTSDSLSNIFNAAVITAYHGDNFIGQKEINRGNFVVMENLRIKLENTGGERDNEYVTVRVEQRI